MGVDQELSKELGMLSALAIGVGVMICAGIFVLPAPGAKMAGPASVAAFVLAGFVASFTALSISELGTAMPRAGAAYYYINDSLGPMFGSIAGWGNWIGLAASVAFYLIGLGSYTTIFLPVPEIHLGVYVLNPAQFVALMAGIFFIGVNIVGTRETGNVQIGLVILLVTILSIFTVTGLFYINLENLQPFAPPETGGWGSIFPAAALIFVTYLGFAEINTAAEEIQNPARNIPLAVIGSLVIVTVLYALIIAVMTGVVGYQAVIDHGDVAVVKIAEHLLGPAGRIALLVAGLLAMASSANASILASSRINFAMGRDGIIPEELNVLHPRFETPYRSIGLTGALVLFLILIGDIEVLAKAGSVLHLIVYGLLNVALIVYRETDAEGYEPDFKIPFYPIVPTFGTIFSFGLIAFVSTIELLLTVIFVTFGFIWYFLYARS